MFPGRHDKKRRTACLQLVPYIKQTLREQGVDPSTVPPDGRRDFVRTALLAAVADSAANQIWLGMDKVYSSKRAVETALLNLYWTDVCEA